MKNVRRAERHQKQLLISDSKYLKKLIDPAKGFQIQEIKVGSVTGGEENATLSKNLCDCEMTKATQMSKSERN